MTHKRRVDEHGRLHAAQAHHAPLLQGVKRRIIARPGESQEMPLAQGQPFLKQRVARDERLRRLLLLRFQRLDERGHHREELGGRVQDLAALGI